MNMKHLHFSPSSRCCAGPAAASAQQVTKENARRHQELLATRDDCGVRGRDHVGRDARDQEDGICVSDQSSRGAGAWRDVDKHRAAAEAAGLRDHHVPFNGAKPDPKAADQFVKIISSSEAAPAFIHCASANRASAMWLIKRIVVDKWEVERAEAEAAELGLTNAALKQWAIEYARPDR